MKQKQYLHKNWVLKLCPEDGQTLPAGIKIPQTGIPALLPGTVHTDLMNNGLIPDPFYADNELSLQWISELDWLYETQFDRPQEFLNDNPVNLVCEGLDTIAKIVLNGQVVAKTQNMFRSYSFNISDQLKPEKNVLQIFFTSPLKYGKENRKGIPQCDTTRHPDRVFIRKTQYSFGWDWGPSFPTVGIWRPLYLIQEERAVLKFLRFDTIELQKKLAKVRVLADIESNQIENLTLTVKISDSNQSITKRQKLKDGSQAVIDLEIPDAKLWWPAGYGYPNLYNLQIGIIDEKGQVLDELQQKVGIRTIKLELIKGGENTFRFIVNSKPVFLQGANWIPADSFLPRIEEQKYKKLISLVENASMNVLRVWGGGIYEEEIFYELCDQMGILVWQDFMFACAAYPEDREFLNEVEEEVKENVLRLQRHPSLAIWCGNNENEWNWVKDKCGNLNVMPGFTIFHKLIPGLLKELDPLRPYWPSSPFGMDSDPNDYASGNTHQWDIWSKWIDYTEVVNDKSLFVSEFGFQGPANYHTFQKCIPEKEFKPQSRVFEFHNKQEDGPERIYRFLSAHLPIPKDIKSYIYLAQLNQALALKTCLEHWRMRWPETGGSIVWQLNDCWPVTSWALIDSEVNPKLAYYDVKRTFANPLINFQETEDHLDILLKNFSNNQLSGYLNLVEITLPEGNIKEIEQIKIDDISKGIETNKVISISKLDLNNKAVLVASLNDSKGGLINRTYFTPGPWKYLHLPQLNKIPEIEWDDVNNKIIITTTTPCFFIKLRHPDLFFSDNGFILLPGEKKSISILKGLIKDVNKEELEICCLNQYLD